MSQPLPIGSLATLIVVELAGEPQGKGRPRFGQGRAYTPAKTRAYEKALAWQAKTAMRGRNPLEGPLAVTVRAFIGVPPSWSAKKKAAALDGIVRPTGRPDFDNLAKVIDALNGIVWSDDSQIVEGHIVKLYSERPSLRVEVSPV